MIIFFFFFSSRRRHTRSCLVSWARRCVQETDQRRVHGQKQVNNKEKAIEQQIIQDEIKPEQQFLQVYEQQQPAKRQANSTNVQQNEDKNSQKIVGKVYQKADQRIGQEKTYDNLQHNNEFHQKYENLKTEISDNAPSLMEQYYAISKQQEGLRNQEQQHDNLHINTDIQDNRGQKSDKKEYDIINNNSQNTKLLDIIDKQKLGQQQQSVEQQPKIHSNPKFRVNPTYLSFLSNININDQNAYPRPVKFDAVANQIIKTKIDNQLQKIYQAQVDNASNKQNVQSHQQQQYQQQISSQPQFEVQQKQVLATQIGQQNCPDANLPQSQSQLQRLSKVPNIPLQKIQTVVDMQKGQERIKTEADTFAISTNKNLNQLPQQQMYPHNYEFDNNNNNNNQVYTQRDSDHLQQQYDTLEQNYYAGKQNFTARQMSSRQTINYYGPHALKNLSNKNII
eukprot:TRINITY_DN2854_c0_g1_i4.p1 TRINITY_DN2854_c0_g1~~TRINITY_DN2854_c0_g1_i4.p1  ORF type:complete len:451 (+),score=98.92 TRINITY_DN2854_c0_g1_i4:66-1418(+)